MSTSTASYQPVATSSTQDASDSIEKQQQEGTTLVGADKDSLKADPAAMSHEKRTDDHIIAQKLKILIVVVSYFVVSMSMVFFNKTLLTEGMSIPAPLFVTWYQCVVTAVIVSVLGEVGRRTNAGAVKQLEVPVGTAGGEKDAPKSFFAQFPPFEFDFKTSQKVLPLSIVFVLMIALNNLCLQYVEVTFYQVARGLTTVFNVALSYIILGESTSLQAIGCCMLIIAGFYLGVENEVRFTLIGTVFGVASSLFVCLNAMFTKKYIQYIDGQNQYKLLLYNNLNAIVLFLPVMFLAGEHMVLLDHWEYITSGSYWTMMTLTGLFGFLIGIITVFQITLTSPLTHNIAGTAKATLQTVIALMIYQNPVTFKGLLGIALVLGGSTLYTMVRNLEMNAQRARRT